MFKIVIVDVNDTDEKETKLYEQTVDALDLRRVIDAINYKPRVYTKRAPKAQP